ncbi:MAG TPA: c-type cytochrome [Ramlibacter sp.]|jgi:cytochrome c553|uniref:c-type cytochrome n=1 Tax=Ramlibacter sp. TaxID=1917967 RepID=UPI002D36130E|nr:c-type cytochrome [Ramlibacter sp.]HZY19861.1 c-type cytochrome [Ramlibacter sp.]
MNQLLTTLFALVVASATGFAHAQAAPAAPAAPAAQPAAPAQPAGAKSLEAKVAMCLGCHNIRGYQASFPEVHRVPMLAGQSAGYIEAALAAYKGGERKHPTMRGIADALTDQDIKDIAGWYAKLGQEGAAPLADKPSREPSPQVAALLQKAACVSCHGANFSKPIAPNYPKIGGQHKDYLFVALKAYKTDNNAAVGRNNAIMGSIAKQFSTAELKALADYIGTLEGDLKTVPENRFRH